MPFWSDSAGFPIFPKLDHDLNVDVVIVGAGITGLTTACLLALSGRSVAVLERDRCAQIDSGHTSAHLTMVTDTRLTDLESRFGRTHAQAVWDAGLAAIMEIETIVRSHRISCAFERVDGYLHAANGEAPDVQAFQHEARLAAALGFDAAFVADVPFMRGPGIRFSGQARFHPRKYLAGLAKAFRDKGGQIFEHSDADDFHSDPLTVRANGHTVHCRDVVIATHNPLVGIDNMASATLFQTKLALYSTYVVAGRAPRGAMPDALYWDNGSPYRYLRLERHSDHDVVIYGGEDHRTGQETGTNAHYGLLERSLLGMIPSLSLTHRWSGQVIETPDGLPFIGRVTDHQYAATGFSGNGLTFGSLAGMMLSDAIAGRKNPWTDLFDPGRSALKNGLWDYIKENASYPYYMIRGRLAGTEGRYFPDVKPGEGKIVEHMGLTVAAYRDDKGDLTVRSAACTHMGCFVAWNDAERTWDCPCHGSRFTPKGEVISGPAETPLGEPGE